MKRKRNRAFVSWKYDGMEPKAPPAQFDLKVAALGLQNKGAWAASKELAAWVRKNYTYRYVPEALLQALGLSCEE